MMCYQAVIFAGCTKPKDHRQGFDNRKTPEKARLSGGFILLYQIILFRKQTKRHLRNLQILYYRLASSLRNLF